MCRQVERFVWGKTSARLSKRSALRWLGIKEDVWRLGRGDECYGDVFSIIEGEIDIWAPDDNGKGERTFGRMIAPQKDGRMAVARVEKGTVVARFSDVLEVAINIFCSRLHWACASVDSATLVRCSGGAVEPHLEKTDRKRRNAEAGIGNALPPPCIENVYYPGSKRPTAKNADRWRAAMTVFQFANLLDVPICDVYDESKSAAAWRGKEQSWKELHAQTVQPTKKIFAVPCSKMHLCPHAGNAAECARQRGTAEPAEESPFGVWSATPLAKKSKD